MKIFLRSSIFSANALRFVLPGILSFAFTQNYHAQTRVIVNPGLEFGVANATVVQHDANFGFGATFDAGSTVTSPWYTSHPTQDGACTPGFSGACHPIEVWGTGFGNVTAFQGSNFVELNAYVSSMIYQNMYLVSGDVISFSFRHRARVTTAERAAMVIEDQNQVNIATVRQTALPSATNAWSNNAGNYTFTGVSGVYRVGFRAIVDGGNPGTGNLLDDIRITLNPLIDLKFSNALSSCEGSSNGNLFMRINGAVTAATTVAFQMIDPVNGTAVASDNDITVTGVANSNGTPVVTHTAGSSIYLITIPNGNYDGGATPGYSSPTNDEDGITINIASVNDTVYEPDETFKFEIKQEGTNGSTSNFVSTASPISGDTYYPRTNDYFIRRCVCYNDANTATTGADSKVGFSLLQKATPNNGNWPSSRKSAHMVLESNNKGFVISRLTTAQVTALVSPQEGMMVYDTDVKCLKLYDGTAWSCFNTPTCP
ncbi:hypothetical protein A0O34_17880 [Chryseobacterium glaciei]|uniref:Uncharacterized protein n=1 Tax=Chryseobacterium glaciei TaxID=1685010 RepID=A0A172XZA0_9FLAO|nr:hypothetical protein [Chryseobacterium glaciei]ANF52274.1 hypothetical protein A0O34_17880 [Chryseobacterium glaciei]